MSELEIWRWAFWLVAIGLLIQSARVWILRQMIVLAEELLWHHAPAEMRGIWGSRDRWAKKRNRKPTDAAAEN